ncbi:MAG: ABC transporter transmembrane domain-containing protein, partial [Candidatus Oxydemutatoraceae bacterium WSBS_2016_MAG_OTU14]
MTTDISPSKKPIKAKDLRNTLRHLMPYMRPYKNYFFYALIGMGLYSLGQVGIAALVKVLVDQEKIFENVEHSVLLLSIGIFSVFTLRGLGNFLSVYFLGIISTFITRDIRQDMFRRLLHIPLSYYDQRSVGQILSKLTYNVERITIGTSDVLVTVVRDFIVFVGLFFWVIYLNWLLAVFLVILGLPISLLVRYATKRFQKIHKRVQEVYGYINADIHLAIENNMSIKVSNAQDYMQQKFEQNNDMIYWQKRKEVATRASNSPLLMIVASLSLIFLVNLSAVESLISATSIGTLASAVTAIFMIFRPLNSFARLNTVLQASLVASDSVFSLLKEPLEDKGHLAFSSKVPDTIEFNNVSFRYKNATENALSNINLTVRAG